MRTLHPPGPAAEGCPANPTAAQWHSHTLLPWGSPSASHHASHRQSGTSDMKQSAEQGSTVPFGHSSGGHAQEGECWARINGTSGRGNPLSSTGSHRASSEDRTAAAVSSVVGMTSAGQSPSMMMVTIARCRIVRFLRVPADAVIRHAKRTDQRLVCTVASKSDLAIPAPMRWQGEGVRDCHHTGARSGRPALP